MRIVWLTWKDLDNPLAGGAEVVNEELAARLAAAGHSVTFLTGGFSGAKPKLTRRGFTIIRTGGRFSTYLTTARYFMKHRGELSADLVVDECNTMPYFAGWYSRTRTVHFFHMLCREIWFYQFPLPLAIIGYLVEPIYLRLLKPARTITISESTRSDLIRHGTKPENISLISEGIQLTPVPDLSALTKYPNPTILSHGSVRPMKRTLDQLKAFEIAKKQIPNLKLKIAGDTTGSYGANLLAAAASSPYATDIEILGRVTEAQKITLMQRSQLIAVTSVKEGWGLIVTEAASQGTPAVVYNVDGLRDSVQAGETGLVTEATPAALADGMIDLLTHHARYQTMRAAAWQWSKTITFDRSYQDFIAAIGL